MEKDKDTISNELHYAGNPTEIMSSPGETEERRDIIYIVRHAQSLSNITRKMIGPEKAILTDHGKLEAKLLGKFLENEKFTVAISSDYPRAQETAQIVLRESAVCSDLQLQTNEKIREKFFGVYERDDVDYSKVLDDLKKSGQEFVDWIPEGGESRADMEERIESFLKEVFTIVDNSEEPQTILVVTHADVLTHFFKFLASTPEKFTPKNWKPEYFKMCPNTGYIKIAIEKNPQPIEPRVLEVLSCHENLHLKAFNGDTFYNHIKDNEDLGSFKTCVQQ